MLKPSTRFGILTSGSFLLALAGCGGNSYQGAQVSSQAIPGAGTVTAQAIGSGRLAVRNECYYALDNTYSNPNPAAADLVGPKPTPLWDGYISRKDWNYIATDSGNHALSYILNLYLGKTTDLIPGSGLGGVSADTWISRIINTNYGLGFAAIGSTPSQYPHYGHGLECPSFAAMIIYRATGGKLAGDLSSQTLKSKSNTPLASAQPGDVIFNPTLGGPNGHTAICVRNQGGTVTMVDSNYMGGNPQEVIGRHDIAASTAGWYCYSGAGRWY